MEASVYFAGAIVVVCIGALFYYLARESTYAFNQKFTYGFRFAAQSVDPTKIEAPDVDPNASVLSAHHDATDGPDDREDPFPMPTLESLRGVASLATGTALTGDVSKVQPSHLYRDDWRASKSADKGDEYLLFAYATPEYRHRTMRLAWQPDTGSNPDLAPYDLKLRLVHAPQGVVVREIVIDLKSQPSGSIELPTFIARTDADRTNGYVFRLEVTPSSSGTAATLRNLLRNEWGPTLAHPRYGMVPLIVGTLAITGIAMLLAAPVGIYLAVYLAEVAPRRLREWLKPCVELLSSVPTVVLGYFGLMIVAPNFQQLFQRAVQVESGRALLTTAVVMAVLLVPTIATVAEDALRAVPKNLRDGAEALGLTAKETLSQVQLPAARAGLVGALLLGTARAIGETMIVWMLSGGTPGLPTFANAQDAFANLMRATRGLPDTIAIEMGNVDFEGVHYGHLFVLGLTLFCMTLAINLIGHWIARRSAWRH